MLETAYTIMVQEVPRKLTRHILICVNSFNSSDYVGASLSLVKSMNNELMYGGIKYTILCTYGGADAQQKHGANPVYRVRREAKPVWCHALFIGKRFCFMHQLR